MSQTNLPHAGEHSSGPSSSHSLLYVDLQGCNVGFQACHPRSIAQMGNSLAGISEMGGVWEWTSTVLEKWDGFHAMEEYPGYTGKSAGIDWTRPYVC